MAMAAEALRGTGVTVAESPEGGWPRISLITPVWNSGKYIEQTIRSVLAQGYPNFEYFIVDGGSTDGSLDIIRKYESQISGWISEPDKGMYDALNKGFARTSGEIMGWISATDQLHTGAMFVLGGVFRAFPEVDWITGRPTWFNEEGMTYRVGEVQRWSQYRFLAEANRYIQQESTFWRRRLWEKAGGYVDASRRNGSDFELWTRFFRSAKLYSVDALIGGFRMHAVSMGLRDLEACHRIHDEILAAELERIPEGKQLQAFRRIRAFARRTRGLRYAWWRLVEQPLYKVRGPDWPPVIRYDFNKGWTCKE
jgi:glycosyltransferase involved in cell wall biosynthesis